MSQDKNAMFDIAADLTSGVGAQSAINGGFKAGVVGSYAGTNTYDCAVAGTPNAVGPSGGTIGGPLLHDYGRGRRLLVYAQIVLAVTSAGAATLECDIVSDTNVDLGSGGYDPIVPASVLVRSAAIPKAALVAGYRFRHGSTPGLIPNRYLGVMWIIGGATITAGKVTSGLMLDVDDHADVLG